MSKPQRIVNIAGVALQDGGNGKGSQATLGRAGPLLGLNLSSASYKAIGRVTPADHFDGEDTNDTN